MTQDEIRLNEWYIIGYKQQNELINDIYWTLVS